MIYLVFLSSLLLHLSPIFSFTSSDIFFKYLRSRNYFPLNLKQREDTTQIAPKVDNRFTASQTLSSGQKLNNQMLEAFNSSLRSCDSNKIAFSVMGKPMALGRHRSTKSGIIYNPCKKLQEEFLSSCSAHLPPDPLQGPLHATILFYFQRPKNHYSVRKNSTTLKPGMELFYNHRAGKFIIQYVFFDIFNNLILLNQI